MFKSVKSVGIMALILIILVVIFIVAWSTSKQEVTVDSTTGQMKIKQRIFGIGARKVPVKKTNPDEGRPTGE